jgi:branched-chain amino acid transport system permease protein
MRIVNVAQGEFIVLSAYIGLELALWIPISPFFFIVPVAAIAFLMGFVLQGGLLNRVLSKDPKPTLLITFGLSIMLRNLMVEVWTANTQSINIGAIKYMGVNLLGLRIGVLPLIILAVAIVLFAGLQLLMNRTWFGRVLRATADDFETVQLFGVNYRRIFSVAMGISLMLSAVAGMLIAVRSSFNPFAGADRLLISFEVVIIGGLGSIWGMMVGGIILGVAQLVSLQYDSNAGLLYAHLVFFLILMVFPSGISGWRQNWR